MDPTPIESSPENPKLQLLKVSQVAKLLATSDQNVYNMIARGEIPSVKFGRSKLIRKLDLERFIEEHLTC